MKIILDTDPGVDDAIAIFWLLAKDFRYHAELIGITTTEGNLRRQATFDNACRLLELCNRDDVLVAKGEKHPGTDATNIHGADGLSGQRHDLPKNKISFQDAPMGPAQMVRWLNRYPDEITIIAIGPVTNLAAAEKIQSGILAKAERIIILGGAFQRGNVTDSAEFNVHYNRRAFREVLGAHANLVLIPLDITRQLDLNLEHLQQAGIKKNGLRVSDFLVSMTDATLRYARDNTFEKLMFAHDSCAIGYAFHPDLFEAVDAHVDVIVHGEHKTLGRTYIRTGIAPNVMVLRKMDANAIREIMLNDILELSKIIS